MTYRFRIGSQSLVELLDGDFMIIDLELLLQVVHILSAAFLAALFPRHLSGEITTKTKNTSLTTDPENPLQPTLQQQFNSPIHHHNNKRPDPNIRIPLDPQHHSNKAGRLGGFKDSRIQGLRGWGRSEPSSRVRIKRGGSTYLSDPVGPFAVIGNGGRRRRPIRIGTTVLHRSNQRHRAIRKCKFQKIKFQSTYMQINQIKIRQIQSK